MANTRKTLFISDLHLEENQPDITQQFLHLLMTCDASVDALYILGDFFEVWIGDDDDTPFHKEIISALKTATQKGLSIYILYGNRDFLIGKKFLRETGCKLLSDEEKINLYHTPVLVMHGDTLCTRDTSYIKARKTMRNIFLQTLFLLLPLRLRRKIAENLRAKSMRHTESTPLEIMDVTQEEVEKVMKKNNVHFLIHGHTHRPGFHTFTLNHEQATRIVLGAWHDKGNVLVWEDSGEKKWVEM